VGKIALGQRDPPTELWPLLGVFLDVGAGGLRTVRKIDKVRQDVQRFVALRIDRRLFGIVGGADGVGVVIGRGFWRNFCGAILFRLRQFPRIHDQLQIRFVDIVERDPVNIWFLFVTGKTLFRPSVFTQFVILNFFAARILIQTDPVFVQLV